MNLFTILMTVVLIPSGADRTVRIAADEFAKYYREVTGRTIAVTADAGAETEVVRIGFRSEDDFYRSETDAYTVKSVRRADGTTGLDIVGSNSRSVLYGVYDFFRTQCGCAWFWDGDVVPRGEVRLTGVDLRERSRFVYRGCQYFAHHGLTRFHAEQWGFDDWRRELDWCVKNRLNVFYMHFGSEDAFQLAFPEIVKYPDPAVTKNIGKDIPGYNYRTPFWSMQFKNLLRKAVLAYARERGMMHPEKIGPMSHWFFRTPEEYLAAKHPTPMPQANSQYSDPTGLMWDVREQRWFDEYWRLSEAMCREYGEPEFFFNCGFDERTVYTNRAENLRLKIEIINRFNRESARRRPGVPTVLEGWDLYGTWKPEEVAKYVEAADPKNHLIWDFTADATGFWGGKDFTTWGITNRFPYVFGLTLAHNRGMDIRGQYELLRARERAALDDPMCKGYVIWPETSHTDIFAWRYFAESSWKFSSEPVESMLAHFCRDRYGAQASTFERIWQAVIPMSQNYAWPTIAMDMIGDIMPYRYKDSNYWEKRPRLKGLERAAAVFENLAQVDWRGDFVRRDSVDLARTALDRLLYQAWQDMMRTYYRAAAGRADTNEVVRISEYTVQLARAFSATLDLHTDFSLAESLDRLDAVERVRNPEYEHVFFENSACGYCLSHQAEYARGWYLPATETLAQLLCERVARGDYSRLQWDGNYLQRLREMEHPIRAFRPDPSCRTPARYREVMRSVVETLRKYKFNESAN